MIEWNDSFTLNNPLMDKQHKKIFALIKKISLLVQSMESNIADEHKRALKVALIELVDYCKTHFRDEEEYLKRMNFPLLKDHEESHESLRRIIKDILKASNDPLILAKKGLEFAEKIAYEHILKEDLLAVSFFEKAVELKEIHQDLKLYTEIKISQGFSTEKKYTYVCACALNEVEVIECIHQELQGEYMMRCYECECPYVYLENKGDAMLEELLDEYIRDESRKNSTIKKDMNQGDVKK